MHWCIRGQSRSALQAARAILEHWLSKDENTEIINKDLETAGRAKFGSQACKFVMHDVDRVESTYSGLVAKACCVLWWLPVMRTAAQQELRKLGAADLKCPKSDALIPTSDFPADGLDAV